MIACKTCQRTEDGCGQPYTKGYLDCHDGDCQGCDFDKWLAREEGGKSQSEFKECRKCGKDFNFKRKHNHHIYCWSCWKQ